MKCYEILTGSLSTADLKKVVACIARYFSEIDNSLFVVFVDGNQNICYVGDVGSREIHEVVYNNINGVTFRSVRSKKSCRCIDYGYDGQIYLLLSHNDTLPDFLAELASDASTSIINSDLLDGITLA